ncbi:hypothetical protein B9057_06050 [Aestuarium zhoushanense]|nr:hypothetical protein B9057_02565 [Aestuarium zhoushanense]AUJ63900.1 hypothetical protein B9057_06050 [Aestuarium zhoushanense]
MSKDVRVHPVTGDKLTREERPWTIWIKGQKHQCLVPGWYPEGNALSIHESEDFLAIERFIEEIKAFEADDSGEGDD